MKIKTSIDYGNKMQVRLTRGGRDMKTYVLIAEECERKLVEEFKEWLPSKYKVIVTGVGGTNIIESLKEVSKRSQVINIGYCGSNNLDVGQTVIPCRASLYHPNLHYGSPVYDLKNYGSNVVCFTSNDFVTFTKIKATVIFDMELAFICSLGFKSVMAIKKVSDKLDYKQYKKSIVRERSK